MSFPKLLEVAFTGTLRQEPPTGPEQEKQLPPETRVLRGASYEGLRRLAGRPIERLDEIAPIESAQPELLPEVAPAAATRLLDILEVRPRLLLEWLGLAAAQKLRIPPLCLPDLLEYARTDADPDLRELIAQVGGNRMTWLAKRNPEWAFAAVADPERQIATASRADRPAALRRIRRQDARRGRELLQQLWISEGADSRARLLQALAVGLSPDDEPFLQQAVRDGRKEVRETALRLIRRIPGSNFGQRWTERARQVITLQPGGDSGLRLDLRELVDVESEWVADGLDPHPPRDTGTTAWILKQVLALTPPSIWPPTMLDAIDQTDWPRPLLGGLAQAAEAYADSHWCAALLLRWASTTGRRERLPLSQKRLFAALQTAPAEALLRHIIELDSALVLQLADARPDSYSLELSHFIVQHVTRMLNERHHSAIVCLLDWSVSSRLDPRVLPAAERLLDGEIKPFWLKSTLEDFVETIDYRAAMHRELNPHEHDA